jgi:hypothetical protein
MQKNNDFPQVCSHVVERDFAYGKVLYPVFRQGHERIRGERLPFCNALRSVVYDGIAHVIDVVQLLEYISQFLSRVFARRLHFHYPVDVAHCGFDAHARENSAANIFGRFSVEPQNELHRGFNLRKRMYEAAQLQMVRIVALRFDTLLIVGFNRVRTGHG